MNGRNGDDLQTTRRDRIINDFLRDHGIFESEYDGELLDKAIELADRTLGAGNDN